MSQETVPVVICAETTALSVYGYLAKPNMHSVCNHDFMSVFAMCSDIPAIKALHLTLCETGELASQGV